MLSSLTLIILFQLSQDNNKTKEATSLNSFAKDSSGQIFVENTANRSIRVKPNESLKIDTSKLIQDLPEEAKITIVVEPTTPQNSFCNPIPIPTSWPNVSLEEIPTTWKNLRMIEVSSGKKKF